jgi:hypothetical protein
MLSFQGALRSLKMKEEAKIEKLKHELAIVRSENENLKKYKQIRSVKNANKLSFRRHSF